MIPSLRRFASAGHSVSRQVRNTTILCVRKDDKVVIMGDGQVTMGEKSVAKGTANKLRRVGDSVVVGFAGSTADAMTLMDKLENKITEFPGQLLRACVELAKEWRGDKQMRQLEASMIVANTTESLEIDGVGNVIAPESGVLAIGSGGLYAKSAALALVDVEGVDAEAVCRKSMTIATSIDVFSNNKYQILSLEKNDITAEKKDDKPAADVLRVEPFDSTTDSEPAPVSKAKKTKEEKSKKETTKKGKGSGKPSASKA